MVATPITAATRYYPPGTRAVYWVPTIANIASPTRAELDAGIDLTGDLSAMSGFNTTSATVSVPDLKSRFAGDIGGQVTAASSSITMYTSEDSHDARQLLPRDTDGFVIVLWEGDEPGKLMDVYPVTVVSQAPDTTITNAGTVVVTFAVPSEPAENVTIPGS
jgi:hypothetical protein